MYYYVHLVDMFEELSTRVDGTEDVRLLSVSFRIYGFEMTICSG